MPGPIKRSVPSSYPTLHPPPRRAYGSLHLLFILDSLRPQQHHLLTSRVGRSMKFSSTRGPRPRSLRLGAVFRRGFCDDRSGHGFGRGGIPSPGLPARIGVSSSSSDPSLPELLLSDTSWCRPPQFRGWSTCESPQVLPWFSSLRVRD